MTDLLGAGETWLSQKLNDDAAITVTLTLGAASGSIEATIGETTFRTYDERKAVTSYQSRDYEFSAADFVDIIGAVTPTEGMLVAETDGGVTYQYAVGAPKGTRCWEYVGTKRERIKVHTRLYGKA
jgi:hypothetical protein